MRAVPECDGVTLPFWDEYVELPDRFPDEFVDFPGIQIGSDYTDWGIIPAVLTTKTFPLDGKDIPNPLYSYTLQRGVSQEKLQGADNRYSKPAGYSTVRFPLSGLVGTPDDKRNTELYNAQFDYPTSVQILNKNVANWLKGNVVINPDGSGARIADATSIRKRLWKCLWAPNYTVFSNTQSQNQWIIDNNDKDNSDPLYVVSLESPHNGMHLATGGFYQAGQYDADPDPYKGANGDMGCNETAGFDPIFFMHHCFIDYMFWKWQELNELTYEGSLDVIEGYPGTIIADEAPVGLPKGSSLDMTTPLQPFRKSDGKYYTSNDVTDITALGYTYGPGSIDAALNRPKVVGDYDIKAIKRVHGINRAEYKGSFVIKTFAKGPGVTEPVLIGAEPVLSRWSVEGCANCQTSLMAESHVPLDIKMVQYIAGDKTKADKIEYSVTIQTFEQEFVFPGDEEEEPRPHAAPSGGLRRAPIIDDLI